MKNRLQLSIVIMISLFLFLTFGDGCGDIAAVSGKNAGTNVDGGSASSMDMPSTETHGQQGSAEEPQPDNEGLLPAAIEIERGGEEYDYADWTTDGPLPDIYIKADKRWKHRDEIEANSVRIWKDPQNGEAEIMYQVLFDLMIPPKEAILSKYGGIIEKGGNVEHGEFVSKYLYDAYYCKYEADGYVYIEINFWYYPDEIFNKVYDGEELDSISYKNLLNVPYGATMDETSFWKAAQSIYVGLNGTGDEPYIPPNRTDAESK